MTPLEALNELAATSVRGSFWMPNRFIEDNAILFGHWLDQVRPISAGLLVLLFTLGIIRSLTSLLNGRNPGPVNTLFVWTALLGAFLTVPGLYWWGVRLCISVASVLADSIHTADLEALDMEVSNLMKGILGSTQNPVALFTALLELLSPVGLLSVTCYYLVIACLYALPYVQSLYLAISVMLGPLLLPFAVLAPMRAVARQWFLGLLGASFLSVFGIIAYTAVSVSGILTNLAMAGERHIPSLVYSCVTLGFLLSVVWSSFRLFGAFSMSVRKGLDTAVALARKAGGA